ncbi:RNA recognition motif domain-containing protein [Ditylenchus destructor]|uniref:RNA recognition motif domain-containing protein n=1 Tax=Ditylenchus destructor TaxID=166010 RepID=A0AAD4MSJ4_9BILA|nr:RNA recognition motif domain-containing protein [Ditylenchus destructor]
MDSRSILRSLSHFRHLRISPNDSSQSHRYLCMDGSNNGTADDSVTNAITKRYLSTLPFSPESISDEPKVPFRLLDPARTIFIGGLSKSALEDSLKTTLLDHFSKYGTVTSRRLPKDKESGEFRGFGYVEFASSEEAERASKFLWHRIDGKSVVVKMSDPKYGTAWQAQSLRLHTSPHHARRFLPKIEVHLFAISQSRFKVTCKKPSMNGINALTALMSELKTIPSHVYHESTQINSFEFRDYNLVVDKLREFKLANVHLSALPEIVKSAFSNEISGNPENVIADNLENIDDTLVQSLFPFQKVGVRRGIQKNGRVLLADEMGLGKTIQALGIAHHYRQEWPLLIVCPASVKRVWKNQIEKFLPSIKTSDINLIEKSTDLIPKGRTSTIVIMSYELMTSRLAELEAAAFNVIIFDESHFLKESKTKRTEAATVLSKIANRKILLTGTPALSRPNELFPQIHIIDPEQFPSFYQLHLRYQINRCVSPRTVTNSEEFAALLQQTVLIRRLKKDVLDNLPEKRREIIWLTIGESELLNAQALNEARETYWRSQTKEDEKENLLRYYVETAKFKSPIVGKEIAETYFYEGAPPKKMIIFAHHIHMLDWLSEIFVRKGLKFIRIDGSINQARRSEMCEQFQNDPDTTVALLSITAAGIGITLTAASHMIFTELYWNPGNMMQAEDRAHRVGQKNPVIIQYMLARKTADEEIWGRILEKLDVLDRHRSRHGIAFWSTLNAVTDKIFSGQRSKQRPY